MAGTTEDERDRGRRGPSPWRIALAVLSVVVFVGAVVLAVTGWLAWVGLAMLLAFIDGVSGGRD